MRYLENFSSGQIFTATAAEPLSEPSVLAFARDYDPQYFHVDPDRAAQTMYGGLIASGWQTGSITMRLMCEAFMLETASLGSPGMDELRWLKPVRPGDILTARVQVDEVRPSQSRPTMGTIRIFTETLNQAGEVVMAMRATVFVERRPHA